MNEAIATLANVRRALESGAASAVEVTEAALDRIARDNDKLHAFVVVDGERARLDAAHIDALRKRGVPLGPLAGAPIGVKDIIDVAGHPTRAGSLTRAGASEPSPISASGFTTTPPASSCKLVQDWRRWARS